MDMPSASDFFAAREARPDDAPLDDAVERAATRSMAEQEKSAVVSGIAGTVVIAIAAGFFETALWFIPILALRCLCMAHNYRLSHVIARKLEAGEPIANDVRRFDLAMIVNGASWGIVVWPVGGVFAADLPALVLVMATLVSVGVLVIAIAPRPRALHCALGAFGLVFVTPLALSSPAIGLMPLAAGLLYIVSVGVYGRSYGKRVRAMIRVRIENQHLVAELGKANGRLSKALETAERLSQEDSLTGLLNRRAFDTRAAELMEGAGKTQRVYLLLADIDRFKAINDTFGHAVGDTVIQLTADALVESCGSRAICARWGGEEFLVAMTLDGDDAVRKAARRIAEDVDRAGARLGVEGIQVSVSVGHARWSALEPLDDAIGRADEAMYRAKQQRRGEWRTAGRTVR